MQGKIFAFGRIAIQFLNDTFLSMMLLLFEELNLLVLLINSVGRCRVVYQVECFRTLIYIVGFSYLFRMD